MESSKNLIDMHAHLAAFPDGRNGCYMSPSFQKGTLVKMVRLKLGLGNGTPQEINARYKKKIISDLSASKRVRKVVLLALDGIYDEKGELDKGKTHMMVSNDAVFEIAEEFPDTIAAGASVNPMRKDALEELDRVFEKGARLIKVLPNSQVFDPLDPKFIPFYKKLADRKIPLLSHIGYEFSVTAGKQEYGFPDRLSAALDNGVTVIGAHACSSALFIHKGFDRMMWELVKRYPNFLMDLSAVTLPNRARMAFTLQKHPELTERLLFGTDYPLSAYATPFLGRMSPQRQWRLWRTKNIFDKQAGVLDAIGIQHNQKLAERLFG